MPNMRQLYRTTGLNQAELARRARLSQNTIRKAENGEKVSSGTALAIAEAFSNVLGRRLLVSDIDGLNIE